MGFEERRPVFDSWLGEFPVVCEGSSVPISSSGKGVWEDWPPGIFVRMIYEVLLITENWPREHALCPLCRPLYILSINLGLAQNYSTTWGKSFNLFQKFSIFDLLSSDNLWFYFLPILWGTKGKQALSPFVNWYQWELHTWPGSNGNLE